MIRGAEVTWSLVGTALVRWWHPRHFSKRNFKKPVLRYGVLLALLGVVWMSK